MLIKMTPKQISNFLEANLYRFDNPAAYIGGEPNTTKASENYWNESKLKVLLSSSADYMQNVGNTTIPLLYQLSNGHNMMTAGKRITDRHYSPASHKERNIFVKGGVPPFGLDNRRCMSDYDVVGMSLSYSPYWLNCITVLKMAGIPVRWRDRMTMKEKYPLIIGGGLDYASPWQVAPTVDAFWCGDAEDEMGSLGLNDLYVELAKYRENGMFYDPQGRGEMLHELGVKFTNLFIPRFVKMNHEKVDGNWRLKGWEMAFPDLPKVIKKRIIHNLDNAVSVAPPVPYYDPTMGLGTIQIAKGCTYHCGFCAASHREAPYREMSQASAVQAFKDNMHFTGAARISPLCLEFGTYSRKKALMKECLETVTDEFSMPSLRVDVFARDPVFGQLATLGQKNNAVIAIEGDSQKLREIVSKGITEDDILKAFANVLAAGYKICKLYFICNLPGEDINDYNECLKLCQKLDAMRQQVGSKIRLRISWKPLTVQAWTPFQWLRCRVRTDSLGEVMQGLKDINIGSRMGDETTAALGTYIQVAELADDIASEALTDVAIETDSNTFGMLSKKVYQRIIDKLAERDRTLEDYFREKDENELFAWDIIDPLISKKYLLRVHKLIQNHIAGDARLYGNGFIDKFGSCTIGCANCGACETEEIKSNMGKIAVTEDENVKLTDVKIIDKTTAKHKFIIWVDIDEEKRFAGYEFYPFAIRRAANLAGLHPTHQPIKIMHSKIKTHRKWFGGRNYFELSFLDYVNAHDLPDLLNQELLKVGMKVVNAQEIPIAHSLSKIAIHGAIWEHEIGLYSLTVSAAIKRAFKQDYVDMTYKVNQYRMGLATQHINLRDVLYNALTFTDGTKTKLVIHCHPNISPYDIATGLLGANTKVYRSSANHVASLTTSKVQEMAGSVFTLKCKTCGVSIPDEMGVPFNDIYCIEHYFINKGYKIVE